MESSPFQRSLLGQFLKSKSGLDVDLLLTERFRTRKNELRGEPTVAADPDSYCDPDAYGGPHKGVDGSGVAGDARAYRARTTLRSVVLGQ